MEKTRDLIERYVVRPWLRFTRRTDKLIQFMRLGWNDYDSYYENLLDIMNSKFDSMGLFFSQRAYPCDNSDLAVKVCRVLKKSHSRWLNEDYYDKFMNKKLPFKYIITLVETGNQFQNQSTYTTEVQYADTQIKLSDSDYKLYTKRSNQSHKFERRMRNKYKRIYFNTLYKHIEKLWD